ncbi:aromatic ring-hydroxylating oxygenase subunit alpha [Gloeothece verrucosa]|uniref:Rieske (2Fe-2S) iron-sulfur domain protein n=1 Tax=Gloeothece verrucosa (strain PCC 7822) TaxID=497965 RepID=E0UAA5_GLOV7|nr:aromatic ring-hydroxylating dioxygenase subunit alpha [Gloeothece verrucosa]ADN17410.1 Rieske (2Fe-2S) iron-sulfur domain protein [Gloeothece verrucosa PCC 7822]
MESTITLSSQPVQNRVREIGINPNYWYPVAWAYNLKPTQIIPVVVWQQAIAVYRDSKGQLHALENACPHKGVVLDKGEVRENILVCPYHGWEFNPEGECIKIPYLPPEQKLPCAKARSYPVQEKYGIIWVFPGDASLATQQSLPDLPEYNDPDWIIVEIPAHFKAHFSICNENTMDVFHGFLHRNLQGWFDPILLKLRQQEDSVYAEYRVSYRGWISKFINLTNDANQVTTRTISIEYNYPHYHSTLEGVSSLYLMRLPVSLTETRSFSLFFIKVRLPKWLVNLIRGQLTTIIWHFLFKKFLDQDIEMIESEQQTYLANPQRQYVEINPSHNRPSTR